MANEDENNSNITDLNEARTRMSREKADAALRKSANGNQAPHEPILNMPPVVKWLTLVTLLPFLLMQVLPDEIGIRILLTAGFIPARYVGDIPFGIGGFIAPITHMFLHGGWLHLAINIGTLLAFGAGLEKNIGGKKLLVLYFASGLVGAAVHFAVYPHLQGPLIGASGAISGLFGGILMLMYANGVMGNSYMKLLPFIAIWIGVAVFFGFVGVPGEQSAIAWTTHIGGFIGGLLLYNPILRLKI